MNAQVKITRDAVRAALQDARDAARVGGLRRHETIAILHEFFGEDVLSEQAARKAQLRAALVRFRETETPASAIKELEIAAKDERRAEAELARLDAAWDAALAALDRARSRRLYLECAARRPAAEDELLLEATADPAIDRFIDHLDREFDKAHSAAFGTEPDFFTPDSHAIAEDLENRPRVHTSSGIVEVQRVRRDEKNPLVVGLVSDESYRQLAQYTMGLKAACTAARQLKTSALAGEELLAALERIELAIPFRRRALNNNAVAAARKPPEGAK